MKRMFKLINKNLSAFFQPGSQKPTKGPKPIITISREKGSGGYPIGLSVAKKLGHPWKVYHREIIDQIAKESKLKKALIKEVDEKKLTFVEKIIDDLFGKRYLTLSEYYRYLIKILSIIGQRGHAVIIGRGANFLFPDALKIRIVCRMKDRIENLKKFLNLSEEQAKDQIEESDEKRQAFIKAVYGKNAKDPHNYDLIICTGPNLSIDDAASLIVIEARKRFGI